MLQGISSCVGICRVRGRQLGWCYSYQIYGLHTREITTAATALGGGGDFDSVAAVERTSSVPLVDQSFTATHHVADGRRFEFATVIVKTMNKGRTPLNVWQHACSLIGSRSPPTFGVAFVSKPSESAKQAIQVFAQQLALTSKGSADSCVKSDATKCHPLAASQVETPVVGTSHDTTESLSTPSEIRSSGAAGVTGENADGRNADIPPIIGCIMDDMGDFESSEACQRGKSICQNQTCSTPKTAIAGTKRERVYGFHRTLFDDDDEDEATLSDWEGVCTEYIEEAARGNVTLSEKDHEDHDDEEPTAESTTFSYNEDVSKEGLVSFLNALTKRPQSLSDEIGVREDVYSLERGESKSTMQRDEGTLPRRSLRVSEVGRCLLPMGNSGDGVFSAGVVSADGELRKDRGGASPVEIWTGGAKSLLGNESKLENSDEDYKLVLCVGHMPGAKAIAFHSSTTGLPCLPELEKAVTVNNPHMLLVGAPGFVFPDFIQRLSSLFPLSCRAGAFLAPLFTSEKSQWTKVEEKTSSPLFFGSKIAITGVVGLAISAKGKGGEVPADAFAELVRMSVGMPRIPGFIFLDELISTKLFLPKNVTAQHLSLSLGSSLPGKSTLILDQLSEKLLKDKQVPTGEMGGSVSEIVTYPAEETIEVGGVFKSSAVYFPGSRGDPRTSDKLPLALFDAVLFPGWSLPFYIFEPCYRAMVRHCVKEGKPFGLSAMNNASWTNDSDQSGEVIGTIANLKVHAFQRDCRSYIIAHGLRRFRVPNKRIWAKPGAFGLTMGEIQYFDDKECETTEEKGELAELANRAVALCLEVIPEGVTVPGLVKSAYDPIVASFAIGHVMDVPTRVKRRWLKLVDTKTRLLEQIAFLETKASTVSS